MSTVPFPTCCVYTDCPVSTVPFPTCCVYTDCPVSTVPLPTCCVYTDCPVSTVPFSTPVLLLYLHGLSCVHSPIFNPCPVAVFTLTVLCPQSHFQPAVFTLTVLCPQSHFQPAVFTLTVLCPQSHFQPLSCCCIYTDCPASTVPFLTPVQCVIIHHCHCHCPSLPPLSGICYCPLVSAKDFI